MCGVSRAKDSPTVLGQNQQRIRGPQGMKGGWGGREPGEGTWFRGRAGGAHGHEWHHCAMTREVTDAENWKQKPAGHMAPQCFVCFMCGFSVEQRERPGREAWRRKGRTETGIRNAGPRTEDAGETGAELGGETDEGQALLWKSRCHARPACCASSRAGAEPQLFKQKFSCFCEPGTDLIKDDFSETKPAGAK